MEILLFVFFLIVFILMLTGGYILQRLKKARKALQEAADKKEQQFREEVGRQRQQYSQRQQPKKTQTDQETQSDQNTQNTQNAQSTQTEEPNRTENARRTQTATGETIIDHHHETRENRKIFDDEDGEYVEFEEA